ncbi:hypothetical protein Ciccas_007411 [Cichlidogyrus casuarinus]|uniref:Uncharacterized protein n=1 Tax=Cichlidogyrus casuarinus TaxID=1844966 RepID=A0ABD2Q3L8_9PLAT
MIEFAECQPRNHESAAFESSLSYQEPQSDFKFSKKDQINYDLYSQQVAFDSARDQKWNSSCQTQRPKGGDILNFLNEINRQQAGKPYMIRALCSADKPPLQQV